MASFATKSSKLILWLIVIVMVFLAIAVTSLRVALPKLDYFQTEISHIVEEISGIPFEIGEVKGYWRNTHPSISLKKLNVPRISDQNIAFDINEVELEFDLIKSIITLEPKIASLNLKGLHLDISNINVFKSDTSPNSSSNKNNSGIAQVEKLFFRQLKDFNLLDSFITYQTYDGDIRTLDIEQLKWRNKDHNHRVEGSVSVVGTHINSLVVKADFDDNGSIRNVSGDFFLQARNIRVTPWLTNEWIKETGITGGNISFNSWFSVKNNNPVNAYVALLPSELSWQDQSEHLLVAEEGVFKLTPSLSDNGWKVSGHSLRIRTDEYEWPNMDLVFESVPNQWTFNVSQLELAALKPLVTLIPNSDQLQLWLSRLQPKALVEDLRISQDKADKSLSYSASITNGEIQNWELLPEVHDLQASVVGNESGLSAHVTLIDDIVPYGDVFQAPLRIKNGELRIHLATDGQNGWRLWSDKISVATPDIQAQGEFRLDFPHNSAAFLSLYAEADVYNAGETWRYLPTRALGQDLTNYLSTAIQGGKANNAKIIWYGPLSEFPYQTNDGIFQVHVGLQQAKFSFDTHWPTITDMQLDLLFENDSMYLDSQSAKLNGVKAQRITGQIQHLGPSGAVEIKAKAVGKGQAVRDYMMATPLVNSVGAALTAVKVSGDVSSEFQLKIPFDTDIPTRAWGFADLNKNHINIESPPMELKQATGRITFDNDIVSTSGLSAYLLEQPISLDFKGESLQSLYSVGIDIVGHWDVEPLTPYLGSWTEKVQGYAPWNMGIDLQLNDVGFTYQLDSSANLEFISSQYPVPLEKALGKKSSLQLQASGNQQSISARLQLPDVKYQAQIDITGKTPILEATSLLVGKGGFKVSPIVGHDINIRMPTFDLDSWLSLIGQHGSKNQESRLSQMNTPDIPMPQRVDISTDKLTFATLDWNHVEFSARKKNLSWLIDIESAEVKGQAKYLAPYDLTVALDTLHVFIPSLDSESPEKLVFRADEQAPLISEFDRSFHQLIPNLTLNIQDFWLQGYKVGTVDIDLQRKGKRINWNNIAINSGKSQINAKGWWELNEDISQSSIDMSMKGENNTELLERFGIRSGIQKAPFEMTSHLSWNGAPWSMQVDTLNGDMTAKFGKGIISGAGNAAKFLGMFSLDSIIRKMQLDFTDVFDKGLAFSHITGSGKMEKGVFVTNNLEMDATAGEMLIRGMADLNNNIVDAEVEFTPDLTSGIPVLTAFAVAPQTAIVVFAISTVISPVVDVFTKIRYQIVGTLDSPEVKELSRSKGEYKLPSGSR
ncbi:YhdP family protein [Vibrio sp. TH_r3]|uniref:YhdP family protein n=1 Tax=Vibrio sp. TH_r3 TaxID=3082084 RepID=UPI0029558D18|nr:YhdP family protein [Vibrio sp. TH_r3]MDV7105951.1 YhdP family protein [Vibrio sp. TH_r3]